MSKIIGADGKEYGPIPLDQLRQWMKEGRVNLQTMVLPEGATDWIAAGQLPELAANVPPVPSPMAAYGSQPVLDEAAARAMVNGPAIGLIVTAALGFFAQIAGIVMNLMPKPPQTFPAGSPEAMIQTFSGGIGVVAGVVGIIAAVVVLIGALKMKNLESHGWAVTASVIALLPCVSPCCLVGLPIGIWALVVLNKPEVKAAFH